MVTITEHAEGCVLAVRAQPGARKAGVLGEQAGSLKVAVTARAQDNKANQALVEVLYDLLGVRRSQVELLSGSTSREKKFLIRGVGREELAARVLLLTGGSTQGRFEK